MWPIQSSVFPFIVCTMFLFYPSCVQYPIFHTIGPTDRRVSPALHFKTFEVFLCSAVFRLRYCCVLQCSGWGITVFRSVQVETSLCSAVFRLRYCVPQCSDRCIVVPRCSGWGIAAIRSVQVEALLCSAVFRLKHRCVPQFSGWGIVFRSVQVEALVPRCSRWGIAVFRSVQVSALYKAILEMQFLKYRFNLRVTRVVLLNAAFTMAVSDGIAHVHLYVICYLLHLIL
jgi:hypothetical protein